jgi:hypothetical protein
MMDLGKMIGNVLKNTDTLVDAARVKNVRVLASLLGPAVRGFVVQKGKAGDHCDVPSSHAAHLNWSYGHDQPELARLYALAKQSQWDGATALDWSQQVDPEDESRELIPDSVLPLRELRQYRGLSRAAQARQRHALLAWILSQFLHGEQGALVAACQVTESVHWMDGKFYGSTQVMDEGRHVEVFHRYLSEKMDKLYLINDNLYVIIDALLTGSEWDLKFLGMQIMIEGLALGGFGTIHATTREPLLKKLLQYVITDEARHVHFGVVALREHYSEASDAMRRNREDWAFEMALLLRNRFLAHEFYDEYYGHLMSRAQWNRFIMGSEFMKLFRRTMFRRIVPNLKRIHLLSDRVRPHYEALGLLEFEHGRAAPELTAEDLLAG